MKLLLPLLLLAVTTAEFTDYRTQYTEALAKFGDKDGIPTSESKEMAAYRYNSFVSFASEVAEINADDSLPFTAENNFLSILTPEERKSYYGLNISQAVEIDNLVSYSAEDDETVSAPSSQDFRSKIPAVKDQGSCGSCWTFSATAALEGEIYFVSGTKVSTSEQEYLDCASSGNGCNGGWMDDCYTYSKKSGRIATTQGAPYKNKDQGCSGYKNKDNALKKAGVTISGTKSITNDAALLKAAATHVVSVAVKVSNAFSSYKSGVMTSKSGCMSQPDHAVAVVGYGKSGSNKYWLVRNSWGKSWGDAGHIKMTRDIENMCQIGKYGIIPELTCSNGKSSCKKDDNDDSDDGDDDSDDGDDDSDDSDDDGDDSGMCWDTETQSKKALKKPLKKCYKTLKGAAKACESKSGACKAVMKKNKKCYQIGSSRTTMNVKSNKRWVLFYKSCGNDGGDDDSDSGGKCGAALVWCKSCTADDGSKGCCIHEHMCKD